MAVSKIAITGNVLGPDGAALVGMIECTLSEPGTADDGGTAQWVGGTQHFEIANDGSVTFNIVANDDITPAGTYYKVVYRIESPIPHYWGETWQVANSPSSQDIGDITRLSEAPAWNLFGVAFPAVASLPTASASYRYKCLTVTGGAGVEDITYQCLKNASDTYDWVQIANGGL